MPSSSNPEVRVPIDIPVETNAAEAADDVSALRDRIASSRDVIRDAASSMRGLRGSTDAVKAAKDQLRATIEREKNAVSEATMKLMRQGTSYEQLADQAKKAAEATKANAAKQDELKKKTEAASKAADADKLKAHKEAMAKSADEAKKAASAQEELKRKGEAAAKAMVASGAAIVAAVVAVTAAAVAGATAFVVWALKGADAARSMHLVREAALGSSLNARNLGSQVEALAGKVPTSAAALNELASSLSRSRLGGQTTVDTLNAVAQASAAIDDSAGGKIREIVERGRLAQRMYLGLYELQGTGLDFDDVATALSKSMHVGINEARAALAEGRVKLGDGAKAMRDAVESKFGDINLRKMMSLEGLADTLGKKFAKMTSGIDLERASRSVFSFLSVLDDSTATGAALKRLVTLFGDGIVSAIEKSTPYAKAFVRGLVIGGLEIYVAYLRVKNALTSAFDSKALKPIGDAISKITSFFEVSDIARATLYTLAGAFTVIGGAIALSFAPLAIVAGLVFGTVFAFMKLVDVVTSIDWKKTGSAVVDGIVDGIRGGFTKAVEAVKELGAKIKGAFTGKLEIHSPSRVMYRDAKNVPGAVVKAVDDGAPDVERAIERMATPPKLRGSASASVSASAGGGRSVKIEAHLHIHGGGSASKAMQEPGVLEQLSKMLRDAAAQAGLTPEEV